MLQIISLLSARTKKLEINQNIAKFFLSIYDLKFQSLLSAFTKEKTFRKQKLFLPTIELNCL